VTENGVKGPSMRWVDDANRTWVAKITLETARKLRDKGFDLLDPEALKNLISDPFVVVEFLIEVHREQFEKLDLSDGDFAELCTANPEVSEAAADALVEGLGNFFERVRRPALAAVVRKTLDATRAVENQATERVMTRGGPAIDKAVRRSLEQLDAAIDAAGNE